MKPLTYWRGRLEDISIFYRKEFFNIDACVRYEGVERSNWPDYVSLQALYNDYIAWFRDTYISPMEEVEPYKSNPELLPTWEYRRNFFIQLAPVLYLNGNKPKKLRVKQPRYFQGSWFNEQQFQRFIRLQPWQTHVGAYESLTKTPLAIPNRIESL